MTCKQITLKFEDCSVRENPIVGVKYKPITPAFFYLTNQEWGDNAQMRMEIKDLFDTPNSYLEMSNQVYI